MRYVRNRMLSYQQEMAYRIYVTDSLQLAPQGKFRTDRYADVICIRPKDHRTGEEIATDVMRKAGLSYGPT